MSELLEELRAAGKLREGWDDNEPVTSEWFREEYAGQLDGDHHLTLENGDYLFLRKHTYSDSLHIYYKRTGTTFGGRTMSLNEYTEAKPLTRGMVRYWVAWTRGMAAQGLHLGVHTKAGSCGLRPFVDAAREEDVRWL